MNGIPPEGGVAIFNSYWGSRLDLPWDGCWATMVPSALYTLSPVDFTCGPLSGIPLPRNRAVIVAREGPGGWLERSVASPIQLIDPLGLMSMDLLVGGSHALIQGGQPRPLGGLHQGTGPRTAIGVDSAGFLYLVVVDGRSETSGGMTMPELQAFLQTLGLVEAINLDGGGSSEMVMLGQVRNVPSDGAERPVAGVITVTRPRPDCGHPLVRC